MKNHWTEKDFVNAAIVDDLTTIFIENKKVKDN